ncbi:MAG: hypothetical protein IPM77_18020 [Crocinitomicaceae bacterium]|nr:hypothetical protein [Crocinitomicaceae bacterium]
MAIEKNFFLEQPRSGRTAPVKKKTTNPHKQNPQLIKKPPKLQNIHARFLRQNFHLQNHKPFFATLPTFFSKNYTFVFFPSLFKAKLTPLFHSKLTPLFQVEIDPKTSKLSR